MVRLEPHGEPARMLLGSCWDHVESLHRLCQLGLLPKGLYVCNVDIGGVVVESSRLVHISWKF